MPKEEILTFEAPVSNAEWWWLYVDGLDDEVADMFVLLDDMFDTQLLPWGQAPLDVPDHNIENWRVADGCLHIDIISIDVKANTIRCKVTRNCLSGVVLTNDGELDLSYSDVDNGQALIKITRGIAYDNTKNVTWVPFKEKD